MQSRVIKILQFPLRDNRGGTTQYILRNWYFIDKTRFHFDFATLSSNLFCEEALHKEGCQVFHVPCYAETNPNEFYQSFINILKNSYDVVHLHTGRWQSRLAEKAAVDSHIPKIIIHAHTQSINAETEDQRVLYREQHEKMVASLTTDIATDYWACSRAAAHFLFGNKIPQDKIRIMLNAIELERFSYNSEMRQRIRSELNLKDYFVIGHIGRFAYPKNQEFILHLSRKIIASNPNIRFVFVGEGSNLDKCKKYIIANNLTEHIIFTGFRNDTENMLQAFDAFVLPSFFEGFPLSLLEAQAAGLHCYVSDSITQETNIANHVTFLPLDESVWAEALLEASRRPYIRENMYGAMTEAGFNIRYQIKEIEKGYRGEL